MPNQGSQEDVKRFFVSGYALTYALFRSFIPCLFVFAICQEFWNDTESSPLIGLSSAILMFIGGLSFGRWYRRGSDRETVHLRWLYKDRYATNIVRGTRGRWGVSERFTILRRAVLESIVLVGIPAGAIAIILDSQGWLLSYLSGFGLICLVSFGIIATVRFDQCFGEAPIFGVSSDVDQGADVAIGPKGGPNVPRMTLPT